MRKMLPGEPMYMIILVGVVFAAGTAGFIAQRGFKTITEIQMWTPRFKAPIMLFIMLLLFQSIYSYLSYNNIIIVGIGLMSYLAPMFAIAISYFAISDSSEFRRTLWIYCIFALLLAASVYLSFSGNEHQLLKEVGSGLLIYDQGTILKAHAGYMRYIDFGIFFRKSNDLGFFSFIYCCIVASYWHDRSPKNDYAVFLICSLIRWFVYVFPPKHLS